MCNGYKEKGVRLMWEQINMYFQNNLDTYLSALWAHFSISVYTLIIAIIIAVPLGILCVKYKPSQKFIITLFGILRIIPSLALLMLLIPILGVGVKPALVALSILAIPPILMNTVTGLDQVPTFMIETAVGMGMTQKEVWKKVRIPLALPMLMSGIKTSAVEVIASATLAAKIGAGGLGEIIFTGIGLNRTDFLIIGGVSVALLSLFVAYLFSIVDKHLFKYKN